MKSIFCFSILILIFVSSDGFAQGLTYTKNARTFEGQSASLTTKGLGFACLGLQDSVDGLPCNPAMTPFIAKPGINADFQLSNGYSSWDKVRKIMDAKDNPEAINFFFTEGKVLQIDTQIDITFKSKYLSGQFIPNSLKGLSVVRNEVNPDAEISAMEETGFVFQTGYLVSESFSVGLQTRIMSRKFIRKQFKLLDLTTQNGSKLLESQKQNVAFAEPAATWFLPLVWKPRFSVMVGNLGTQSPQYSELPQPIDPQVGFAVTPPTPVGKLDLLLDYKSLTYEEKGAERLRLGSIFSYGSMRLFGGVDANGISGGVFTMLQAVNAGVTYSTTKVVNENEGFFTQTVYLQIGWQN